jgi:hypothetical protein
MTLTTALTASRYKAPLEGPLAIPRDGTCPSPRQCWVPGACPSPAQPPSGPGHPHASRSPAWHGLLSTSLLLLIHLWLGCHATAPGGTLASLASSGVNQRHGWSGCPLCTCPRPLWQLLRILGVLTLGVLAVLWGPHSP